MRTIVDNAEFLAQEIRPTGLLDQYRALSASDVARYLVPGLKRGVGFCPACHSQALREEFSRFGLAYASCQDCGSLFAVDRPEETAVRNYYLHSEAERFWQEKLARQTEAARLARVVAPRIDWMLDVVQEYLPTATAIADVATQLVGYAERLAALERFSRRVLVAPVAAAPKGVEVTELSLPELEFSDEFDVITLFDVLDRTSSVDVLLAAAGRTLRPGGLMFLTDILSSGFDVQILWDRSETVFPPDRLNVFSATGLETLLKRHGFQILEFSTPGAFDVAAVGRALENDPALPIPRFVHTLMKHRGAHDRNSFQTFLQSALMSSFGRVVARWPG